jgi:hypothetical protein
MWVSEREMAAKYKWYAFERFETVKFHTRQFLFDQHVDSFGVMVLEGDGDLREHYNIEVRIGNEKILLLDEFKRDLLQADFDSMKTRLIDFDKYMYQQHIARKQLN